MKTITIEIPEGKEAKWVDGVLTLVDDKQQDITERIKTFEDACKWCLSKGKSYFVDMYHNIIDMVGCCDDVPKDLLAYLRLRIITCTLNEGWRPKFDKEHRYYSPFFDVYSQEEWDKLTYAEKERRNPILPNKTYDWLSDGYLGADTNYIIADAFPIIPSSLLFRNKKLAIYAATQFHEYYMDFCK